MANDLKNYLDFFKTLRAKIGSDKLISSDTSSGPWIGADGSPSTDLSEVRPALPASHFLNVLADSSCAHSSVTSSTSSRSWKASSPVASSAPS